MPAGWNKGRRGLEILGIRTGGLKGLRAKRSFWEDMRVALRPDEGDGSGRRTQKRQAWRRHARHGPVVIPTLRCSHFLSRPPDCLPHNLAIHFTFTSPTCRSLPSQPFVFYHHLIVLDGLKGGGKEV